MNKLQFIDIGNLFRIIGKICKDLERAYRFKGINVNFIGMLIDYIGIAFILKWNLHLAKATAVETMRKGNSAMFFKMRDLSCIIEAKDKFALSRFVDKLRRIRLLIIDDYGLTKISDAVVAALMDIADVRYGIGSTIITSQLKKKGLMSVIDESPIRDAFADRLFRDCDWEITLKGASWRGNNEEIKGEKIK